MDLQVAVHPATVDDVDELVRLYRLLETEMQALEDMWNQDDALSEPVEDAFAALIADPGSHLLVGTIDGAAAGFVLGRIRPMRAYTDRALGAIELVFTEPEARGVGVGEALRDAVIDWFHAAGVTRFDAHVLPGHRLAKNFFESAGFSARHIVMHHDASEE